jgi:hypothetical protein
VKSEPLTRETVRTSILRSKIGSIDPRWNRSFELVCTVGRSGTPILDLIVFNGVSTTATMDLVRHHIAMMYPELRMGRQTGCRTTDATKSCQEASSVVITLVGKLRMKDVLHGPPSSTSSTRRSAYGLHFLRTHHQLLTLLPLCPLHHGLRSRHAYVLRLLRTLPPENTRVRCCLVGQAANTRTLSAGRSMLRPPTGY